jgi:cytochrome c556
MSRTVLCAALAAALGVGLAWAAEGPQATVDAREAAMKQMAGAVKAASDPATKPADAKAKLADAIKIAESIPDRFPKGTGIGDTGVTKTRALQDIWKKPDEFKAAAAALVTALKAADAATDAAARDAAFADVRKACGGCHTPFRGPETE